MEIIGTVTSKGQITIPQDIRDEIGLKPGDRIEFRIDRKQNIVMQKRAENPSLAGVLRQYATGTPPTEEEIAQAITQAMADRHP